MNAGLREALADLDRGFALLPVAPDKTPRSDLIRRTRGRPGWRQLVKKPATATEVLRLVRARPDDRHRRAHRRGLGHRRLRRGRPRDRAADADDRDRHDATRPPRLRPHRTGPSARASTRGVELRGERAYVVAPCTRRADGGAYAWELTPEDAGIADFAAFENCPAPTYIRTTCFKRSTCLDHELESLRALADLERDERVALRLARALGAPDDVAIGASFPCLIHADASPSASLWRYEADARVLYRDWHAEKHDGDRVASARARACAPRRQDAAAQPTRARDLEAASRARGRARSSRSRSSDPSRRVDASRMSGAGSSTCSRSAGRSRPAAPAPYSARFAAAWCGVSTHRAHEAIGALARAGSLRLVGRDPRGTRLWLPEGVMPID